ncbi:MAG: hypothetical protein RBR08_07010 [Desulforegulaceae bacterium]|jgi:hypothetical protein|nr:hypothetical protein [Desulforegulaceae bacterium]
MNDLLKILEKEGKKKKKDIRVFKLSDGANNILCYFVFNIYDALESNNILDILTLEDTAVTLTDLTPEALEDSPWPVYGLNIWTCNCKKNYVNHILALECHECGCSSDTGKIQSGNDFARVLKEIENIMFNTEPN